MQTALNSCPFCGSRAAKIGEFHGLYFVICEVCHADGPAKYTSEEAVEAWNTRAEPRNDGDGKH